jgi:peptidoglycan/LPS O-acetylase OafA/YrhL
LTKRYEALDGLRGLAAFGVMLIHIPWSNHLSELHAVKKVFLLVDLFFVLSGFVLTMVYRDEIKSPDQLRRFLTLRLFRIYPLHLAVLLLLLAIETVKVVMVTAGLIVPSNPPFAASRSLTSFFGHLLLLQGTGAVSPSWNPPSWSIGCEAVAYVLFGLATICGFTKRRFFAILAVMLSISCYSIVLYLSGTLAVMFDFGLLRCIAGFFLGCAVATVVQSDAVASALNSIGSHLMSTVTVALFGVGAVILSTVDGYDEVVIIPVFALLVGLLQCDRGIVARVLQSRPFAFLGLVSYSLYMINYPIFMMLDSVLKRLISLDQLGIGRLEGDCLLVVVLPAIVLAAWLSFEWIEAPGRALGRRLARNELRLRFSEVILRMTGKPTQNLTTHKSQRVLTPGHRFDNGT